MQVTIKKIFYYLLITTSCLVSGYFIFIDIVEVIKRSLGILTIFSQMSWLTNVQAMSVCIIEALVFIFLLIIIGQKLFLKNKKDAIFFSTLNLSVAIIVLFVETLFYYRPT